MSTFVRSWPFSALRSPGCHLLGVVGSSGIQVLHIGHKAVLLDFTSSLPSSQKGLLAVPPTWLTLGPLHWLFPPDLGSNTMSSERPSLASGPKVPLLRHSHHLALYLASLFDDSLLPSPPLPTAPRCLGKSWQALSQRWSDEPNIRCHCGDLQLALTSRTLSCPTHPRPYLRLSSPRFHFIFLEAESRALTKSESATKSKWGVTAWVNHTRPALQGGKHRRKGHAK